MRQEALGVAQERALALDAPELLHQGQSQDLRVRESLERSVAVPVGVEQPVRVVDEAEQHDRRLFRTVEPSGKVSVGHLLLVVEGSPMAPFLLLPNLATLI